MKKYVTFAIAMIASSWAACGWSGGESPMPGERVYTAEMAGSVTGVQSSDPADIPCDGTTEVTVQLIGQNGISGEPLDVMLVLDRSGSMSGQPLADLKDAARAFVDILDEASDGQLDGVIANGSRVGMISFAGSATVDQPLTTSATAVKDSILALSAGGLTNHAHAFTTTRSELESSTTGKIAVVMTDGMTTVGGDATDEAQDARNAAIEIFAIGLGEVDQPKIESWVSSPVDEHAFFTASSGDLLAIFEAIGAAIVVPAATGVTVSTTVNDHFAVSGQSVSKGALATAENVLTWTIDTLSTETVSLTFAATHDKTRPGGVETLYVVSYSDAEDKLVDFGEAIIRVHGCAATLQLMPEIDTNTVGDAHTVTARVLDDFGDPVPAMAVSFSVEGGPSTIDGDPSAPDPAASSDTTDDSGQVTFTYTNSEASPDTITALAPLQPSVAVALTDTAEKTWKAISVAIDIKPGSYPNSYGASSRGKIPVALLGSASFDVTQVDDSRVRFGDAPDAMGDAAIAHKSGHLEEVNGDGNDDKVYHFPFPDTSLDPSDAEGCLSGEIYGLDFLGCDSVNIVP
jgi:uncharacterized protein YegL